MTHRLGKRVVHFANLPIKLLMPTRATNIDEIALKTIPSASKVEIKNVLESLYGFQVAEVRTLNMEGKKKKRGGILLAKPDYKKAYVTLRRPLSINPDLFPFRAVAEARAKTAPKSAGSSVVEDAADSESRKHWLHGRMVRNQQVKVNTNSSSYGRGYGGSKLQKTRAGASSAPPRVPSLPRASPPRSSSSSPRRGGNVGAKFPWSNMRSSSPSSFGRGNDGAKFPWSSMKSKFNSGSR